jgi:hypothetical protein
MDEAARCSARGGNDIAAERWGVGYASGCRRSGWCCLIGSLLWCLLLLVLVLVLVLVLLLMLPLLPLLTMMLTTSSQ